MKTAIITGATAGFGEAFAWRLAKLGYRLVLTGRRNDRLQKVANDIRAELGCEVCTLNFDVRSNQACQMAIATIPSDFFPVDLLVNNAGLAAGSAPFDECLLDDYERMIDTNVKGLLYVTKLIVPFMIAAGRGHIVNISSVAGIEVYPNGNVYCATKHAVNAITKGLRIDLLKHGIKVSSISPGMAETEFSIVRFHGDAHKANKVYEGVEPLTANDVADALEFIVTRPAHVSINDIQLNPAQQANTYSIHRKI